MRYGLRMGRRLQWPDKIVAPLPAGSLKRIEATLAEGEDKTDFLRASVEAELRRRERRRVGKSVEAAPCSETSLERPASQRS